MKRMTTKAILATALVLILQGCSQQKAVEKPKTSASQSQSVSSSQASSSSEASSSSSQEKPVKSDEESYQKVFEDYRLLLSSNSSDTQAAENLRNQLHFPLEYWTVDNILAQPDALAYSFHDLNGDGQKELLVGAKFGENPYHLVSLYYLKGQEPALLGESHAASVGGSRVTLFVYRDGRFLSSHWHSGSGNGQATLYQLSNQNQEPEILQQIDFTKTADAGESQFGLSQADRLDMDSLTWKKF